MPALQVRDFPEELYEELKDCAEQEHRSIAQQVTFILSRYLRIYRAKVLMDEAGAPDFQLICANLDDSREESQWTGAADSKETTAEEEARILKRKLLLERIHSRPQTPIPDDFPSSVEIIREMRESRMDQLMEAMNR